MTTPPRIPASFSIDSPVEAQKAPRHPASFDDNIRLTPEAADPFEAEAGDVGDLSVPVASPRKRRFSFGKLALGALGLIVSLALGLWFDGLVRTLFSRSDWLAYTAIGAVAVFVLAFLAVVGREIFGIMRLNAVQALKVRASNAAIARTPKAARAVVDELTLLLATRAETALGRSRLKETEEDIIDGVQLLHLAERELLSPLDRQARQLILNASKRVSIVTAVSPRALVDIGYVVYESARMVRAMADLYGGRPGTLGMMRLMRDVLAHLAVTGSIAVGDSLISQVLGHGLASKLSARLGEGVINGLMTARIGIAAMDLCRPLPFHALKRPGIGDFIGDLTPGAAKA